MKLEAGKRYLLEDGRVTDPLQALEYFLARPYGLAFAAKIEGQNICYWRADGRVLEDRRSRYDIGSEYDPGIESLKEKHWPRARKQHEGRQPSDTMTGLKVDDAPVHAPHAKRVLKELHDVLTERGAAYGDPLTNHQRLADLLNVILGPRLKSAITPAEAVLVMLALKISRLMQTPDHEDSWRDIAGYAAIGIDVTATKT